MFYWLLGGNLLVNLKVSLASGLNEGSPLPPKAGLRQGLVILKFVQRPGRLSGDVRRVKPGAEYVKTQIADQSQGKPHVLFENTTLAHAAVLQRSRCVLYDRKIAVGLPEEDTTR